MGQLVKAGPIGSPARAGQKRGADVDLGAANAMQRRSLHAIKGVDTEFKDKVNKALSDLELTKEVKVLQFVMDQVTSAVGELQKMAHEQGDSLDKHEKHLKNLDVQAVEQDKSVNQVGRDAKGAEKLLEDQLKDLEHELAKSLKDQTERNEVLHSLLATQESVLIERIEEFKALFVKCDDFFAKMDGAKTAGAPATTSVAGAQLPLTHPDLATKGLLEAQKATTLLRGTVDAMQVEMNQLRVEVLSCQDMRVPIKLSALEQATRFENFMQWTLEEVMQAKDKQDSTTQHAADVFEQLRVEIKASACPCPPGCSGKTAAAATGGEQDSWRPYPRATPPGMTDAGQDPTVPRHS